MNKKDFPAIKSKNRYIPNSLGSEFQYQEMISCYQFAIQLIDSQIVLDLGCGYGEGTNLIANLGAGKIYGIDNDEKAINYATKTFKRKNLIFQKSNFTDSSFNNLFFDVVISINVLEQINDPTSFFKKIKQILKPNGFCLISTKNFQYDLNEYDPLCSYSENEFIKILKKNFDYVNIYYQSYPSSISISDKFSSPLDMTKISIKYNSEYLQDNILNYVAICSNKPIPELDSKFFVFENSTKILREYNYLKFELEHLTKLNQHLSNESHELNKQLENQKMWSFKLKRNLEKLKTNPSLRSEPMETVPLPTDATKSKFFDLLINSLLLIKNHGWFVFFSQFKQKLNSISLSKRLLYKFKKPPIPSKYLVPSSNYNFDETIIFHHGNIAVDHKLRSILKTTSHDFDNLDSFPRVSIIIPTYDAVDHLKTNLASIESLTDYPNYEIVIVTNNLDKNSKMWEFLDSLNHIVLMYHGEYSFSNVNNFASKNCNGEFLLFLNDDTKIINEKWLNSMIKLALNDDVGAVGGKLLFPDLRLQEAGCIIWKNGFAWNYGRNKNRKSPEYNFVRDVDYSSASCLLVKKTVFDKVNQFDTTYKIGYGEDSDLCLKIKKAGYRVLYQPKAEIVHYEGITSGTDVTSGIKSQQIKNQKIFFDKWKNELQNHMIDSEENVFFENNRKSGLNILYIDHYVPEYDKDAGSVTAFNFLNILSYMGHKITFWPENQNQTQPYTSELQQKGIEVIYDNFDFKTFIKKRRHVFSICILSRPYVSKKFIDIIKKHVPNCKIIYESSDLHFVRMFREANLYNNSNLLFEAESMKSLEIDLMKKSDLTLFRTKDEAQMALSHIDNIKTAAITSYFFDIVPKSFENRNDLVFLGGFSHPPNEDAVFYFLDEIFPLVLKKLPNIIFYVVGSNASTILHDKCENSKNCELVGYVKDATAFLNNIKLMVAPLRYGSGIKGKIIHSLCCGLPVVTNNLGSEGMGEKNPLIICDSPEDIANKIIDIYSNQELWNEISQKSSLFVKQNYTPEIAREIFNKIINLLMTKK